MRRASGLAGLVLLCALAAGGCRTAAATGGSGWRLAFRGNRSIPERALSRVVVDNLADFERYGQRKSAIDDAAFSVESHYRAEGFPFATATYRLEREEDDELVAEILIDEGPRTKLGVVEIIGNERWSDRELASLVGGPTFMLGARTWFVQAEVDAASAAVASKYLSAGYLLVQVSAPEVRFREGNEYADVTFRVVEGPAFHVAAIRFEGTGEVGEEELRAALPVEIGAPYVHQLDRRIRAAVTEKLGQEGHPDARVTVERQPPNRETGGVELVVRVDEGPRVVVTGARVEGNERTRDAIVLSRLDLEEGEPFTPSRERRSFRRLFTTGLFSSIRLDLEGDGEERELVVTVDENPSREVFFEPGWGSYELARLKAGYRNLNVFGTGRAFRTEGIAAVRHQELEVGVSDSLLFGGDVFADLSVVALQREEPSFTRVSAGLDATLARTWTTSFVTALAYTFERSKARDVDVTDPAALAALDDVDISAIEGSLRYDTRDSPLVPSRGTTSRLSVQWGDRTLGSELDFVRARYSQSHYVGLAEETVLAVSLRTGVIVPTGDTDEIPLQERFFNGGESTVRSFRQDELGPVDTNGAPLGGEAFTLLSGELRRGLWGNLACALFADTGNVAAEYERYTDFDGFRSAVGFGLRYLLPIGPLRLDFAWNPHPSGDEDGFLIHFSVGMPF